MIEWDLPNVHHLQVVVPKQAIDVMGHVNNTEYLRFMEQIAWHHTQAPRTGNRQTLQRALAYAGEHTLHRLAASPAAVVGSSVRHCRHLDTALTWTRSLLSFWITSQSERWATRIASVCSRCRWRSST